MWILPKQDWWHWLGLVAYRWCQWVRDQLGTISLQKLWRCACFPKKSLPTRSFHGWPNIWWEQSGKEMVSFSMRGKMEASKFLIATSSKETESYRRCRLPTEGSFFRNFNLCSSKQLWKTGKMNKNIISIPALGGTWRLDFRDMTEETIGSWFRCAVASKEATSDNVKVLSFESTVLFPWKQLNHSSIL